MIRQIVFAFLAAILAGPLCAAVSAQVAGSPAGDVDISGGQRPGLASGLALWNVHQPQFGIVHNGGSGIGFRDTFWSVESWVPLAAPLDHSLVFADIRGLFTRDGVSGSNLGFGVRRHFLDVDVVLGSHVYYDFRDTGFNGFQQLSLGVEALFADWDFRANAYLPTVFGGGRHRTADRFQGNLLLLGLEDAMDGFDVEFAWNLFDEGPSTLRPIVGCYYFDASGRPHVAGLKAGLESPISDGLNLGFLVQDDNNTAPTVSFNVAIRFGAGALLKQTPGRLWRRHLTTRSALDTRMTRTVRRVQNIVMDQREEVATNTAGAPLQILHVAAGGNSNGSIESPYGMLTDALNDPDYQAGLVDVIYVQSLGQTTHTGNFTLRDGVSLLSSGPNQQLQTMIGPVEIPSSGRNIDLTQLPVIEGDIVLSDNVTLSGFEIKPTQNGTAVMATGVNGFNISNNVIPTSTGAGISIFGVNSPQRITIFNNRISDGGKNGILIKDSPMFVGDITENIVTASQSFGIEVIDSVLVGSIDNNRLVRNHFDGLRFFLVDFTGTINNNVLDGNRNAGIRLLTTEDFHGEIRNNIIKGDFAGSLIPTEFSRIFTVTQDGISISSDGSLIGESGINIHSGILSDITIANNSINSYAYSGVYVALFNDHPVNIRFEENSIDSSIVGVNVVGSQSTPANFQFLNNTITRGQVGISLAMRQGHEGHFVGRIDGNNVSNLGLEGIVVDGRFTGDIKGNTASGNGAFGIRARLSEVNGIPGTFLGSISGNTVRGTQGFASGGGLIGGHGIQVIGSGGLAGTQYSGEISDNLLEANRAAGLQVSVNQFNGGVVGNTVQNNLGRGAEIFITSSDVDSPVSFQRNTLSGNNGGSSNEVAIQNQGAASLTLQLKNNISSNSGPFLDSLTAPPFNFDLTRTGTGLIHVMPSDVNSQNIGSVGSSNSSVAIP